MNYESDEGSELSNESSGDGSGIIVLRPDENHEINLAEYINEGRKKFLRVFSNDAADWEKNTWDISTKQSTQSLSKATAKKNILFTELNGLGRKVKAAYEDQVPFEEPFLSFVKAYVVHRHQRKPVTHSNHMEHVGALRILYSVLQKNKADLCVSSLVVGHFKKAIEYITTGSGKLNGGSQYKTGNILQAIASELDSKRLVRTPIDFAHGLKRPKGYGGAGHARGDEDSKKQRAEKLPKTSVLIFLAALWEKYDELDDQDKDLMCITIILMIAGFRMDEAIGLDIGCIPTRRAFKSQAHEIDPGTGALVRILKVRVLGKKGAGWQTKLVPVGCEEIIFLAVERLRRLSREQRESARRLLLEGKCALIDDECQGEYLTTSGLKEIIDPGKNRIVRVI